MLRLAAVLALLPIAAILTWAQPGNGVRLHTEIPRYEITFKEGAPVQGVGATPAFRLPYECSDDGTVFLTTVQPLSPNTPPSEASLANPFLLISVSPSGEAHSFPLNRVPDLYGVHQLGEAPSSSEVVFLVSGTEESERGAKNRAERHSYLVTFDRQGDYQKKIRLESALHITQISIFSTGSLLAYGYDEQDHSPKLAMLKDDGSLLRFLEIPKGDAPESALGTKDDSGKGPAAYLAPAELVEQGQYIDLMQKNGKYPILRISVSGAVEAITPKLPGKAKLSTLIPSDENLYALVHDGDTSGNPNNESILELDADGAVLRRLQVSHDELADEIACVHDKKFLAFHHGNGQLIPITGTAEPTRPPVSKP